MRGIKSEVIIGLGSNRGNRLNFLRRGVQLITKKTGTPLHYSSIYETPAWGFEGHAFLNACISVKTQLKPEKTLASLLKIEADLGRKLKSKPGYQNRCIDLDILFYDKKIIDLPSLKIPHPEMEKRAFVLAPLQEIAAEKKHPVLKKTVEELYQELSNKPELKRIPESL